MGANEEPNIRIRFGIIAGLFMAAATPGAAGDTAAGVTATPPGLGFSFATVRDRARDLATKDYKAENTPELPDFLKKLDYDRYQDIRFHPERAPWHGQGLRFGVQFLHRGYLYQDPVRIHLVEGGQVKDFSFSSDLYDYGKNQFSTPVPAGLEFAGLRVTYPLAPPKLDEVASFVGASYFRLVGTGQRYGAACRGLAINTAEPGGEEFPRFIEFWIVKPAPLAEALELFALLDSPSISGAFRFVLKPGPTMGADIEASLFPRKEIKKVGIAPLTSMFLIGENRTRFVPDFRPEVHDSDGLLLQDGVGGEWLWRPLDNPQKTHQVSSFPLEAPTRFGLMQRDRDYRDYVDLAVRYELHPSLWVDTAGKWGAGTVELVEIPTPSEWNDNIVAYWIPKQKLVPNQESHWAYSLSALSTEPAEDHLLHVEATRIDPPRDKKALRFIVDFSGTPVPALDAPGAVTATAQTSHGEVRNLVTEPNAVTGGWRAFFDLKDPGSDPVELRLALHSGTQAISETWVYRYQSP